VTWDEQVIGKSVDPRTNSFVSRENLDSVLVRKLARADRDGSQGRPCMMATESRHMS
jgi:hypothetical protein